MINKLYPSQDTELLGEADRLLNNEVIDPGASFATQSRLVSASVRSDVHRHGIADIYITCIGHSFIPPDWTSLWVSLVPAGAQGAKRRSVIPLGRLDSRGGLLIRDVDANSYRIRVLHGQRRLAVEAHDGRGETPTSLRPPSLDTLSGQAPLDVPARIVTRGAAAPGTPPREGPADDADAQPGRRRAGALRNRMVVTGAIGAGAVQAFSFPEIDIVVRGAGKGHNIEIAGSASLPAVPRVSLYFVNADGTERLDDVEVELSREREGAQWQGRCRTQIVPGTKFEVLCRCESSQ